MIKDVGLGVVGGRSKADAGIVGDTKTYPAWSHLQTVSKKGTSTNIHGRV